MSQSRGMVQPLRIAQKIITRCQKEKILLSITVQDPMASTVYKSYISSGGEKKKKMRAFIRLQACPFFFSCVDADSGGRCSYTEGVGKHFASPLSFLFFSFDFYWSHIKQVVNQFAFAHTNPSGCSECSEKKNKTKKSIMKMGGNGCMHLFYIYKNRRRKKECPGNMFF